MFRVIIHRLHDPSHTRVLVDKWTQTPKHFRPVENDGVLASARQLQALLLYSPYAIVILDWDFDLPHSPFVWNLKPKGLTFTKFLNKHYITNQPGRVHNFLLFSVRVALVYEEAQMHNFVEASEHIKSLQVIANQYVGSSRRDHYTLEAMFGIINSSRAHILAIMARQDESRDLARTTSDRLERNASNKLIAYIHGLKSMILMMYRTSANVEDALNCIEIACEKNPSNYKWLLHHAKIIGHKRGKVSNDTEMEYQEFQILKKASLCCPNDETLIRLALGYVFISEEVYLRISINDNRDEQHESSIAVALDIFQRVLQNSNCRHVKARCAMEMANLIGAAESNHALISTAIMQAIVGHESNPVLAYYKGLVHEFRLDFGQAWDSYNAVDSRGHFKLDLHVVFFFHKWSSTFDPAVALDKLLRLYPRSDHQVILHLHKGLALLRKNASDENGFRSLIRAIDEDPRSHLLLKFRSVFTNHEVVNVYDILQGRLAVLCEHNPGNPLWPHMMTHIQLQLAHSMQPDVQPVCIKINSSVITQQYTMNADGSTASN